MVTQQGTGKAGRTGGIDPGRVAPSTQPLALALAIGHGTGKAPGLQGQAGRIDQGTGRHRTTSRASGHAAGHRAPGTGTRSRAGLCMGRRAQASRAAQAASIRAGQHQTKGK
jgi:hypothetical protein